MSAVSEEDETEKTVRSVKTATDLQRLKLEKLLKQPEKPVFIPDRPKERKLPKPPEFIRNTWGSSAGAGSGDFHVYRGVRRREYARQKFLNEQANKNSKDDAYQQKLQENVKAAEERTAKKRAKRLKKKQKGKQQKKSQPTQEASDSESDDDVDENECEKINAATEDTPLSEVPADVTNVVEQDTEHSNSDPSVTVDSPS